MPAKNASENLFKITFLLDPDDWHGYGTESVWAEYVFEDSYRLLNSPFFATGVSAEDVIRATPRQEALFFEKVIERAGHSTYRVIVDNSTDEPTFNEYWSPLQELGCTYESAQLNALLLAVDVPTYASIHRVYELLERGEIDGIWGFEEGHCGHSID